MRVRYWIVAFIVGCLLAGIPSSVSAADTQGLKGLSVSPLRKEMTVASGKKGAGNFIVSNLTKQVMTVDISIKQFSTTDFVYNYEFRVPDNDWVKPQLSELTLRPGESRKIPYTVTIPAGTAPGGYYYTIFASTNIASGLPTTVQAATLLYVTVDGKLIRTSVLQNDSIPFLVTGNEIPYKFDVKNTGNVHFSAYFYGQLESIIGKYQENGTSHLILPDSIRTVNGSVQSPLLPGLYKVRYGYKVDFADFEVAKTAYILFIPPWSVVVLIFMILGARWYWRRRQAKGKQGV